MEFTRFNRGARLAMSTRQRFELAAELWITCSRSLRKGLWIIRGPVALGRHHGRA